MKKKEKKKQRRYNFNGTEMPLEWSMTISGNGSSLGVYVPYFSLCRSLLLGGGFFLSSFLILLPVGLFNHQPSRVWVWTGGQVCVFAYVVIQLTKALAMPAIIIIIIEVSAPFSFRLHTGI